MNKKPSNIEIFLLSAIIFVSTTFAQKPFEKQYLNQQTIRADELFGYEQKATRFLPVFSFDGFLEWSSPKLDYQIGEFRFNNFPLNYFSPDLIPFDIWQGKNGDAEFQTKFSSAKNRITFYVPKSDSTEIFFNSFFGSETGDPAIHVFTKTNRIAVNRNKIPISGIVGARGKLNSSFNYNISAGYFGAYSTGSINDFMLASFDNYYFGKLNKQFMGSAAFDISTDNIGRIKLSAGVISYYGWDVAPFLASFTHFEVINSAFRADYASTIEGLSISVKRDEGIGKINRTSVTQPAEFYTRTYSVKPTYNLGSLINHISNAEISAEVEYLSAGNLTLDEGVIGQRFFDDEIKKYNYKIVLFSQIQTKLFDLSTEFNYKYHFSNNKSLSGSVSIQNFSLPVLRNFLIEISSISRDANITETFGKYSFEREVAGTRREFQIQGTENLESERTNRFSILYSVRPKWSNIKIELFYKEVENPIKQVASEVIRISHERDLLRNSVYTNGNKKSGVGVSLLFESKNTGFFNALINYKYLQNEDVLYSPKNKLEVSAKLNLPFEAKLTFNWLYNSSTVWKDFQVAPQNDFFNTSGFDGKVGEVSSFNLYFEYDFVNFYFLEKLNVKMSFTNIFNRAMRFHPLGNRMDRAFIFSLSGKL